VLALGPLELYRDGVQLPADAFRSARPRELLLLLLLHPEGRTREQIGLVFWPDASATQMKNNFHVTLHHLRRALGRADLVAFEDDRYRVAWELGVELDAAAFEREVRDAVRRPADDAAAVETLRAALARYRGELLAEEGAGDWHLEHRARLARLFADGARSLGERLERRGDHAGAAEVWRRLVAADPLDEGAHRRLMASLARAGERAQALRQYERLASLLRSEGLDPDPDTVVLHERLRRAEAV
jgi:DNA-binding SARP family transcriptional activator